MWGTPIAEFPPAHPRRSANTLLARRVAGIVVSAGFDKLLALIASRRGTARALGMEKAAIGRRCQGLQRRPSWPPSFPVSRGSFRRLVTEPLVASSSSFLLPPRCYSLASFLVSLVSSSPFPIYPPSLCFPGVACFPSPPSSSSSSPSPPRPLPPLLFLLPLSLSP